MTTERAAWPQFRLPFSDFLAGSLAGAAQVIVGQPLDTIKVRAQIAPPGRFRGPLDIFVQTATVRAALTAGMASPLLGIAAQNSFLFTAFSLAKRAVSPDSPDLSVGQVVAAGAIAGAANSVLSSPVELLKIQMQSQYGGESDVRLSQYARQLWARAGFRHGIMRGFWVTVLRETPAYAGFYGAFEATKRTLKAKLYPGLPKDANPPTWVLMISGSAGGIANWLACYPIDVVKSRVQLSQTPLGGLSYIPRAFAEVAREDGLRGFVLGLSPTSSNKTNGQCSERSPPQLLHVRAVHRDAQLTAVTTFELAKEFLEKTP